MYPDRDCTPIIVLWGKNAKIIVLGVYINAKGDYLFIWEEIICSSADGAI